jgi:hypothetical protein
MFDLYFSKEVIVFHFGIPRYAFVNKCPLLTFRFCFNNLQFQIVSFNPEIRTILEIKGVEVTGRLDNEGLHKKITV